MERDMEVRVHMLQEQAHVTPLSTNLQHAEDGRLRKLQWAVTACAIVLCAMLALNLYHMFGHDHLFGPPQVPRKDSSGDDNPRAHVTGTRQPSTGTGNNVLQWESKLGLAFVMDGMRCDDMSIQVPKEGYYFVYAQVSLKIPSNFGRQFESNIIKCNDNYPDPEILFSGKILKGGHQPIYIGGLIHLTDGDQLKVNVTSVDQVDITSNYKTYFGVFWITG